MKLLIGVILLLSASCFSQVYVNVTSPTNSATVASQVTVKATASSPRPITGWHIYADSRDVYTGPASSSITGTFTLPTGPHALAIRAWDQAGAYSTYYLNVNVAAATTPASALPTPPPTAKVFDNIDQMGGWNSCNSSSCAGGSGKSASWQALNQTNPSMDGRSMQLFNSGVWANALWWNKFGANNLATNMLWDFWIYVDGTAAPNTEALEFDSFQFVGGWNYMVGTQCNYGAGVWDTWNEGTGRWIHNYSLPCPKFTPYTWHHIQQYVTLNHTNHTYTYRTFVVDGKVMTLNQTQPAKYLAWGDSVGAQWQIDVNATGAGVHEWVDKAKLTIW